MFSMYGTNVYSSRGGEFDGMWLVWGINACKIVFLGGFLFTYGELLL